MRTLILLATVLTTFPALAHPGHVETAGGHSHWFELAVGGLVLAFLVGWLIARICKNPVTDNG
ncbi:MAG TPA: DUF6732 family protein [Afifellaceae bacterium]|nr:DUF6732 family protein [Afifellaceae bacterium]